MNYAFGSFAFHAWDKKMDFTYVNSSYVIITYANVIHVKHINMFES